MEGRATQVQPLALKITQGVTSKTPETPRAPNPENKIGEALKIDLMLRPFNRQNRSGLFVQIGYKTKGYVMGELLAKSFILRYGISMHL